MRALRWIALRRDEEEARIALSGALADLVQQVPPEDGLVRDDEDVLLARLRRHVDDDVLDRPLARDTADPVDDVLPQPPGLLLWMRGDDDLVDRRLELGERVAHGRHRVGLDHETVGRGAFVVQHLQRPVEAPPGGGSARVLVHDVAALRLVDRTDHSDAELAVTTPLDCLDQRPARDRLVRDDEQMHQRTCTSVAARSPFRTAWRAPGTPYSYGLPTTCGISSKLKTGGGEETCHSSVSDRHGLAAAIGPRRMLVTML